MPRTSTIWPARATPSDPSGSQAVLSTASRRAGLSRRARAARADRRDARAISSGCIPARTSTASRGSAPLGGGRLDPDTYASAGSWRAATLAAGAGLTAVEALRPGEGDAAFCAVRPPGHHANQHRVDGVLLHLNVAVVAASLADAGRAGADLRLRRASRQRHAGHLLRRPAGAVRQPAPVAAVPGHRPAHEVGRGRGPRATR